MVEEQKMQNRERKNMRSSKSNIQNFVVIMPTYVHCILGISQQPCETRPILASFYRWRSWSSRDKRAGLNDGMSPYSQPSTLLMRLYDPQISVLPHYLQDSVMIPPSRWSTCGLERTCTGRVRTPWSCFASSKSSMASIKYPKRNKNEEHKKESLGYEYVYREPWV